MSWLLAFLGFAALIVLHEFGHFAAAKAVGMRVERFALFFPPLLGRIRRGETEYAIGAVPLGGYVRITGHEPARGDPAGGRASRLLPPAGVEADRGHRRRARRSTSSLAFVILWGLYWVNGVVDATNRVDAVAKGAPATGVLAAGDRIVAIDGVRTTDFVRLREQIATHTCAGEARGGCLARRRRRG